MAQQHATASKLSEALAKIDELLEALKNGTLIATHRAAAAPQPAAKPAAPPAPAAAAPVAAKAAAAPAAAAPAAGAAPSGKQAKKEKAKKEKTPAAAAPEGDAFDKAHLAVGRVTSVSDHPSGSEKLWLCKVDVGGSTERQVVAGLRQFISREDLTGRLVAVVLNLKPAKLAGELSEAMILAADHTPEGGAVMVRVLSVPDSCKPGDAVFLEGGQPAAEYPKTCKSDKWKEVVAGLAVGGGAPLYKGRPLVTSAGPLTVAADMPDGAGIH